LDGKLKFTIQALKQKTFSFEEKTKGRKNFSSNSLETIQDATKMLNFWLPANMVVNQMKKEISFEF